MNKEEFFNNGIPGVTTILSNVFGKDDIKDIPEYILNAAAERGSAVHKYIENFIHTNEWKDVELAYQIYIDYFIEWYNEYKPEFILSEQKLISEKDNYKGIIDTVFKYKYKNKEVYCLCDWKTSSNLNIFKTMCQLNLYNRLLKQCDPNIKITELRTLSLTKNGYKFIKVKIDNKLTNYILYLNELKHSYDKVVK